MNTDAEIALEGVRVELAGKEYTLAPLRLCDYAEIEQRIETEKTHPLDVVIPRLEGLPEPLQRHLLNLAYEDARRGQHVSPDEMEEWLATPGGRVFEFWLEIRQHHPELSLQATESLLHQVGEAGAEAIDQARAAVQGEPLGN